jgi:transposase
MNREELMKLEKEEIVDILLALIAKLAELTETVRRQSEEIAELRGRLNQNSKNSSKPPSSDGFRKPKSLREPSGKKAGGQQGHEGNGFRMTQEPDDTIQHIPTQCTGCPKAADCQAKKHVSETRYVVDIEIKTITTAHQAVWVMCPQTSKVVTGSFPENINSTMQYGVNLEALAVSLVTRGAVSINRTHEIMSGVFNIPISTGTISAMVSNSAQTVAPTVGKIKEAIFRQPLTNVDETGTRVDKHIVWAHTASTPDLTYIGIAEKRGKEGMDAVGILPKYQGTIIHDCWASYFLYTLVRHGLCNAHLLRELTAVWENTKQAWALRLISLLLTMKQLKEELLIIGSSATHPDDITKYSLEYDAIMADALIQNPIPLPDMLTKRKPKRGKTGALVDRLLLRKDQYLLFFTDFYVPFDNNQAERDIRMFKVKLKVSGCFRTLQGAQDFAAIMSFISTAHKRGISAFNALKNALLGFPFPVLLPGVTE